MPPLQPLRRPPPPEDSEGCGLTLFGCPESAIVSAQIRAKPPSTKSSAPLTTLLSSEQRGWPPRVPRGSAFHAAIAASVNRTVRLPRWRKALS